MTDLSSVWVEASLLEDNLAAVRVGSPATITTPAYPGRSYRAAVSYIDPQVDPQTRTAKVRLVLDNPGLALRFGMYMDVLFANATGRATVVPKQAIQAIGSTSVVFVPVEGEAGKFIQRTVKTGEDSPAGGKNSGGAETRRSRRDQRQLPTSGGGDSPAPVKVLDAERGTL